MIYPLWGNDIKDCLQGYCLYHCIEDTKGFGYQISASKMLAQKDEVFLNAERYMGFDLTKDNRKNQMLDIFKKYSEEHDTNPIQQNTIFVLKTCMATYLDDKSLFDEIVTSMKKMEDRLPSFFMRIHRSYIVNLTKIQEVNKNRVILDADTNLPVGDLYKNAFQSYLDTKFLGK